jgi:hypothetical protein
MEYVECSEVGCGNPVFARGICRKHYEQERLATAAPCSFVGCQNKSFRGDLCAEHYRAKQKSSRPTCTVPGCTDPQKTLKSGLCERHLFRFSRHGTVEQPRNADWGARESHPLYQSYHWHRRKLDGMCKEWADDFWLFVNTVSPRPDGHTLRKTDPKKPIGPDNWYWKEAISSSNKAVYAKKWRDANPEKTKNSELKTRFGITLQDYQRMAEAQNHRCAICGELEIGVDKQGVPRRMPVDHCHATGKIRELLCSACNKALGGFRDRPDLLRKAAEYVEKHLDAPLAQ